MKRNASKRYAGVSVDRDTNQSFRERDMSWATQRERPRFVDDLKYNRAVMYKEFDDAVGDNAATDDKHERDPRIRVATVLGPH